MRVLITSKSFGRYAPEALEFLEAHGFEVSRGSKPTMSAEEIAAEVPGFDALIVGNDTVDARVLDAGDKLKLVHMNGTGLDGIDVEAATARGILVANAPGANRNAVAELIVGLMLVSARSIDAHIDLLKAGRWERSAGVEVSGKTIGLLGLGNIGKRVVELLSGFGVRPLAYDPQADAAWAAAHGVGLADAIEEVFAAADFLVLTLPCTEATRNIVDRRRIALMKPTARIVNAARGGLVDEDALCEALREHRIAGAALDAFAEEPPAADSPLRMPGITLTPHMAATSAETAANLSWIVARNVVDVLECGKTDCCVNGGGIARAIRR
ncbi:phosphoglycerate dehydrogenase [bacterium]|nr:phosphoglycerate dehydrogenase [bacterium]